MHPFFSIISSQSGFIEMDLLQKMFLLVGHEKNVIYSKLVNNPFNKRVPARWWSRPMETSLPADGYTGVFSTAISLKCLRHLNRSEAYGCWCSFISLALSSDLNTYTRWVDFGREDGWQAGWFITTRSAWVWLIQLTFWAAAIQGLDICKKLI